MFAEPVELARLLARQRLRGHALRRHREARFLALVGAAVAHVPYYAARFRAAGLDAADVRSLDDLGRLPVTSKEDLVCFGVEGAVDRRVDRSRSRCVVTSGTSGVPLPVFFSAVDRRRRRLVDLRAMLRFGVRPRDRIAILGPAAMRTPGWHDALGLFSTTMIANDLAAAEQARRLAAFRPTVLWGYPTFLRAMVENAPVESATLPHPRIFVTSAEILDPATERILAAAFAWGERFEVYGAIEVGRIASECRAHAGLHVEADRAIVELEPIEGGDGLASVIVTALDGETMPMIRYRLGDLTAAIEGPCACGSSFPRIERPSGRDWELLRLPSGRVVPPLLLNRFLKDFPAIDRYRVVQTAADRFVVRAAFRAGANAARLEDLRRVVAATLGEPVQIEVEEMRFESAPGKKFRPFVPLGRAEEG